MHVVGRFVIILPIHQNQLILSFNLGDDPITYPVNHQHIT